MRIARSIVAAAALVLALGAPTLAGEVTLSTPPLTAAPLYLPDFTCSALNVSNETLAITIKIFDETGTRTVVLEPLFGDCANLAPGKACAVWAPGSPAVTSLQAYCSISFAGPKDALRAALQLFSSGGSFTAEAR